jgi:hypothetical protein
MTTKPIQSNDFVRIRNKKLAQEGLDYGSIVYVAATQAFPLKESDQYTLRVKLFVHKLDGDAVDIKGGVFVIDPRSVKPLKEEEHAELLARLATDVEVEANATTD